MLSSARPVALRALLALGLAAPSVRAQAPDTTRTPPDTVFAVEPVLVTASRLPGVGARLGLTLTSRLVQRTDAPWAAELLRTVPGVFVDEASGAGGPTIVRLRGGEEVFTQILVDGVQINQNGGFFDFQGFSLTNLAGVDIARGPQSAVYGSSAVSGVVHFLTPRGPVGDPQVHLRAEGGAASEHGGSWATQATARGGTERLRYSLGVGSAFSRGVYALPHDTRTTDGSLRLDWSPARRWEATLTGRWIGMSSMLPVRDPGATRVPLDPNARNDRDRTIAGLTVRWTPSASWSHYVRVMRYGEAFVYQDERDGVQGPEDGSFFVFDANLRFSSDLARQGAEAGGSYSSPTVRVAYGVLLEDEALEDRITGDFGGAPLLLDRSSVAGFGELAWSPVSALTLGGGLRVERYEGLDAEATPRASVAWTLDDGVTVRAAAGRAYKAPNLQQQYVDNPFIVANPGLRPETSASWEAGVDVARPAWGLGLTAFRQRFDDLIRTVGLEGDTRQTNRNLGSASTKGLEWDARLRLAGPWWISSEGALLDTEILEAAGLSASEYPEGAGLPFRPSHTGDLALAYVDEDGLSLSVRARTVGAQTVLSERFSGRRERISGYRLLGVTASHEVGPGATLYLRVSNLLDRSYHTAFDRPGQPLAAAGGLSVRF